jgi:hypothetical protein
MIYYMLHYVYLVSIIVIHYTLKFYIYYKLDTLFYINYSKKERRQNMNNKLNGIIEIKDTVKTKPSDFLNHPYDSIAGKSSVETVARNIMVILERTGNTFRELSWNEYKEHILKDRDPCQGRDVTEKEKGHFESVLHFCVSAKAANSFSSDWAN